jgi:hypothetical protein
MCASDKLFARISVALPGCCLGRKIGYKTDKERQHKRDFATE